MLQKPNPFTSYGLTTIDQFKNMPFIELEVHKELRRRIAGAISSFEAGIPSLDMLYITGNAGSGKTTTNLFLGYFIENELRYDVRVISALPQSEEDYKTHTGSFPKELTKPLFLIIDFPDKADSKKILGFLDFYECIIRNYQTQERARIIFSLNYNHLKMCFDANTNLMNKMVGDYKLTPLTQTETYALIQARLRMIGLELGDFTDAETLLRIYKITGGIPRSIMTTCAKMFSKGILPITIPDLSADTLVPFYEKIILEREYKPQKQDFLIRATKVLLAQPSYQCESKVVLATKISDQLGVGKITALKLIDKLIAFGVATEEIGGKFNTNKIIKACAGNGEHKKE